MQGLFEEEEEVLLVEVQAVCPRCQKKHRFEFVEPHLAHRKLRLFCYRCVVIVEEAEFV